MEFGILIGNLWQQTRRWGWTLGSVTDSLSKVPSPSSSSCLLSHSPLNLSGFFKGKGLQSRILLLPLEQPLALLLMHGESYVHGWS